MKPLIDILQYLVRAEWRVVGRGVALSIAVLVMGAALLGLSGWFITAAAAAGLAGIGILFNVFAPSAMVRFLALGRTVARYGERLATHDAVLHALAALRLRLFAGLLAQPHRAVEGLRVASVLNRLTADVDRLDGALLRLVLPGLSGTATILAAGLVLWWLVDPSIAALLVLGHLVGPNLVFLFGQRRATRPSRRAEAALQAVRIRLVEMVVAREDLAVFGQLSRTAALVDAAVSREAQARAQLDAVERATGAGLDLIGSSVVAGALGLGAWLVEIGRITAAEAAIGVFVALALSEAVTPVRRALAEIGAMVQAARRIAPALAHTPAAPPQSPATVPDTAEDRLRIDGVVCRRGGAGAPLFAPLTFDVAPGETVALTGPSGVGKSTLLLAAAGAIAPDAGQVWLGQTDIATLPPDRLRDRIVMVPQRHGLISGTIAQNLRLAAPGAEDDRLWRALETAALADTIRERGGLSLRLGARGTGLSGGEARRLALARAVLRQPSVLILDEPTEGLDAALAARVIAGLRAGLPRAAILIAAHRTTETDAADRVLALRHPDA